MLSQLSSDSDALQRRVLVVDDDPEFAEGMHNFLVVEGFEVEIAHSAEEALSSIERFDAQVAILDYRLGSAIGLDLVGPLKLRRPGILCLLATAHADMDSALKALRSGIYDYFSKPFNTNELLVTLQRCFEHIRLEQMARMAEAAQLEAEKMRMTAHMAGGVAHHFNNLLMIMPANVERLKLCVETDIFALALIKEVVRTIDRAADVNRNLLTYTRQRIVQPEAIDVGDVISEALDSVRTEIDGRIRTKTTTESGVSTVHADLDQFYKTFLAIVRNAFEAMPDGGILTIEVSNAELPALGVEDNEQDPRSFVLISITDNGIGMSPDVVQRAFEPFYSGQGLAEKLGLGLSTAYGFARQSGGQIAIESQEGKGTTVKLYLPRPKTDKA